MRTSSVAMSFDTEVGGFPIGFKRPGFAFLVIFLFWLGRPKSDSSDNRKGSVKRLDDFFPLLQGPFGDYVLNIFLGFLGKSKKKGRVF